MLNRKLHVKKGKLIHFIMHKIHLNVECEK